MSESSNLCNNPIRPRQFSIKKWKGITKKNHLLSFKTQNQTFKNIRISQKKERSLSLKKKLDKTEEIPINAPIIEQPSISIKPPFLERLKIDEGVEKQIILPDYNMMDKLRN